MIWVFLLPLFLGLTALFVKDWLTYRYYRKQQQLRDLANMHRRDFEHYIARKLKQLGRKKVHVNKGIKDDGYDVSGYQNWRFCIVQCKCYKIDASIGVKPVRELFGVAKSKNAKALFVTTCRYTKAAQLFAKENGLELWGRENLVTSITIENT